MSSAYEVLRIPEDADDDAIRAAYRRRARELHPDRHGGTEAAHLAFLELQAAYEILSDPERRATHDRDPEGTLDEERRLKQRRAQLKRRKARLRGLY